MSRLRTLRADGLPRHLRRLRTGVSELEDAAGDPGATGSANRSALRDGETHVHHAIADAGRLTSVKSLHANVVEVPGCRRARAGDEAAYGACRADRLQQVHAPWRQTKLQNTNSKCCSAVRRVISLGYNDGTTLIYEERAGAVTPRSTLTGRRLPKGAMTGPQDEKERCPDGRDFFPEPPLNYKPKSKDSGKGT